MGRFAQQGRYAPTPCQNLNGKIAKGGIKVARVASFQMKHAPIRCVTASRDGMLLATGSRTGTLSIWSSLTYLELSNFESNGSKLTFLAFSPNGGYLVGAGDDGPIQVWKVQSDGQGLEPLHVHDMPVDARSATSISFAPSGDNFVTSHIGAKLAIWSLSDGRPRLRKSKSVSNPSSILDVSWSPNGKLISVSHSNGQTYLLDIDLTQRCTISSGKSHGPSCADFSPDGGHLATSKADNSIGVFDLETEEQVLELPGHSAGLTRICYAFDGSQLISASLDGTIRDWDVRTGDEYCRIQFEADRNVTVWDVCLVNNDGMFFSAGANGVARLYQIGKSDSETHSFLEFC